MAPPLQNTPVRLPGPATQEQPAPPEADSPVIEDSDLEDPDQSETPASPPEAMPLSELPVVTGLEGISPEELSRILAPCAPIQDPQDRLDQCAAALTAHLISQGLVNSRVFVLSTSGNGTLEVVQGTLVELSVNGSDERLNARVSRLLGNLVNRPLHLPTVERELRLLRRLPEVESVRGNLAKLGSDPTLAVLRVNVEPRVQPWRGEVSLRNDGSNGSGEARGTATLVKGDLIGHGDTLLLYGELNADDQPELGTVISSISYSYPLADTLSLTGAFGYSRRNLIELPDPADGFSTSQYQGLLQLEWVFHETLSQRWGMFLGVSRNRSNTYLDDAVLPSLIPDSIRQPQSAYLRFGVSGLGQTGSVGWSGNAYFLQGIAAATPEKQRKELAQADIDAGQAAALGGLISASWAVAPRVQVNVSGGGQVALNPLLSPMQFSLGSDVGIRGLPGQLISGDSGWLSTGEVVVTAWQQDLQAVQIVPFIGAGGVSTDLAGTNFSDTVGAGGILARYINPSWIFELGWVESFETDDNPGAWDDWLLSDGLYARAQFRF
ncbi:ShlB/FhaC/HecB family hemolysin secretion/activation protein [Synechococcus sp. RSCCF101]|uniref:ShlB/FhaC/HecB family hemolysin secretion/activation protein n=1 Tax=Synechococcus sp. RSCCF101 TaxID=2511069 RepID=UPI0017834FE3|nr:ShlB/FhaC/HecB family hemolysin secretion/activation protein [Synechococcus sp. RSCCF101]